MGLPVTWVFFKFYVSIRDLEDNLFLVGYFSSSSSSVSEECVMGHALSLCGICLNAHKHAICLTLCSNNVSYLI